MNYITRTSAPTLRPVSLDEAKMHVKVSGTDEDTILGIYLDASIAAAENKLQTAIMDSRFSLYSSRFCQRVNLEKKWVNAINSVKYYDPDAVLQTVSPGSYDLQSFKVPNVLYFHNDYSVPNYQDTEFPIVIDFNAGFTSASGVLPNIRDAIFLEFADRYENRQSEVIGERIAAVMFSKTAEKILAEESLWL